MNSQLNTYEEDAFKLWVLSAERKTLEGLNRPLIERDKAFDTLKEKKFRSFRFFHNFCYPSKVC